MTPSVSLPAQAPDRNASIGAAAGAWSGLSNQRATWTFCFAMLLPLIAGVAVCGWRAAATVSTVVISALVAAGFWQHVGRRGSEIRFASVFALSLLLALTLPAHLFARELKLDGDQFYTIWPILPAAGFTLVMLCWLLGGSQRVHPVLLTHLLLVTLFQPAIEARHVLKPDRVFTGDLLKAEPAPPGSLNDPWVDQIDVGGEGDAITRPAVSSRLTLFTTGLDRPDRAWLSMQTLIRDSLPPLEDLIVAGEPAPIGSASAVAVVMGGLFLLYRGLIDYRIPLLMVLATLFALLTLPVPVIVRENGPEWHWFAWRASAATWGVAVTFANYEMLASPLLFAALFIAPSHSLRPLPRGWRPIFAIIAGVLTAAVQLYVSVAIGPYLALLLAGLLAPAMDRMYRSRAVQ